jgi:hypothetical protein
MIHKNKNYIEWAMAFWLGVGLMSIINVWKITSNQNAVNYSWIMFWISVVFLIISAILLIKRRK